MRVPVADVMLDHVVSCLIVDDNAGFLAAARRLLERQGIAVVGVASTGDEALRRLGELLPDVVLVDLNLGTESGLDVAERLDRGPDAPATPIILISTHAEEDYRDLIAGSPAVGFIPKAGLSAHAIETLLGGAPTVSRER
jgi:two-component system, NarL family, nitrate/nitrite response regulator NarL